jgi:hypothetical protein
LLDISAQLGTFDDDLPPEVMAHLITAWVDVLAKTNLVYLQRYPYTVPLYESDIYYKMERIGEEDFFDIPTILAQGFADCEDLAAWRIAEFWFEGYAASPLVTWTVFDNGDIEFHVQVQTQFGIEDPSVEKGMAA